MDIADGDRNDNSHYLRFIGNDTKDHYQGGAGDVRVQRDQLVLLLDDEALRLLDPTRGWPDEWEVPESVSEEEKQEVDQDYENRVDIRLRDQFKTKPDTKEAREKLSRQSKPKSWSATEEIELRDKKIRELRDETKRLRRAVKLYKGALPRDEMKKLIDETRKKNNKPNWDALGRELNVRGETAKRRAEKLGLLPYALGNHH